VVLFSGAVLALFAQAVLQEAVERPLLCAVIAANILVAVIAIIRAFREEKRIRRFSGFAQVELGAPF
jgi:hypothetical protein